MSVDETRPKIDEIQQLVESLQKIVINTRGSQQTKDIIQTDSDEETVDCPVQSASCSIKLFAKCKHPTWDDHLSKEIIQETHRYLKYFRLDAFDNLVCSRFNEGGVSMINSMCFYNMDHIKATAKGGVDSCETNARVLHWYTNQAMQDKTDEETSIGIKHAGLRTVDIAGIFQYIHTTNKCKMTKHSLYKLVFTAVNASVGSHLKDLATTMLKSSPKQKLHYITTVYVKSIDRILEKMNSAKNVH